MASITHIADGKPRCGWVSKDPEYIRYHDKEWGRPIYRSQKLFEFLILEGAQAGLSWITILKRRPGYKSAFAQFNPEKIARFTARDVKRLMSDEGIIRNRLKIEAAILNAKAYLDIMEEYSSFKKYLWDFVDGEPVLNAWKKLSDVPVTTSQSEAMSKALKKRGFKFVGPTICYAFMQATGMVNDHLKDCICYHGKE